MSELTLASGSEEAFALLRKHGVVTAIVSITWSFAVEWFAKRLGAGYAHGTQLDAGRVEHVWPADKGRWVRNLSAQLELPQQAVAAVGDSEGDSELLEAAGVRYCVGDCKVAVAEVVHLPRASMLEIAQQLVAKA